MINKKIQFFILLSIFYFLFSSPVFAVELFFDNSNQKLTQGQEFTANLFLNTENESANAVEGRIVFPDNLLEVKEIRDGNSIINFWIKQPKANQSDGIDFSGIIPGGYHNAKGFLFSIVFQSKEKGSGIIEVNDAKVLRNDGNGTLLKITFSSLSFSISDGPAVTSTEIQAIKDSDLPESFKLEVSSSPDLFDGKWFIAFATQDKGSGIDHYEIREGFFGDFTVAESPYLLRNQKLSKKIFVKAVDKNNNERIESFYPPNFMPWYKNFWIIGILIIGIIFIFFIAITILWKKFIKSR